MLEAHKLGAKHLREREIESPPSGGGLVHTGEPEGVTLHEGHSTRPLAA